MANKLLIFASLLAVCVPTPGWASTKVDRGNGFFFNKPGATAELATRETESCRKLASGAESQINTIDVLAHHVLNSISATTANTDNLDYRVLRRAIHYLEHIQPPSGLKL